MPIISWLGSTSSPRRAAKLVAVAIVSVSETSVMPIAAISRGPTSLAFVHGKRRRGHPLRQRPHRADAVAGEARAAPTPAVAATTATSTAGTRVVMRGSTSSSASTARPDEQRGGVASGRGLRRRPDLLQEGVGVGGEAEQLRQLAHDDRDRKAVHVADLHLLGEEVRDEPESAEAEPDLGDAHERSRASPRARSRWRSPPPASSGVIAARISGEIEESGPSTSTREGPNTAYPTRQAIVV